MEDYYQHETGLLGQCMDLLFRQPPPASSTPPVASTLPQEARLLYDKMGKYCVQKDLDELLCGELVLRDSSKTSYLSRAQLKEAIKRVGIPVSDYQVGLLVSVLAKS